MMYDNKKKYEYNDNESCTLVINASEHVAGKLASFIAKNLLEDVPITVIHAENIVFTGPIERGVGRFASFLNKRKLTNPLKGPFHHRSPSMLFQRIVSRMVPKKKRRGQCALSLLRVFDSCPEELAGTECVVCPKAMLKYTADPIRKFYYVKDLCRKYGWKYYDEVERENSVLQNIRQQKSIAKEEMIKKENEVRQTDKFKRRVDELLSLIE